MKRIQPSANEQQWPRNRVDSIKCRRRDLVVRIADWTRQSLESGEPGYDVEVYIGGVYDWNQSESCTVREYGTKAAAKAAAISFAGAKIAALL